MTTDARKLQKQFRSWQRAKFPRIMRDQPEVKFSNIKVGSLLRIKTLEFISSQNIELHYTYIHKKNIPVEFRSEGSIQCGKLLPVNAIVEVKMLDSAANANIQIADWIVGAIAANINHKPFGEEYICALQKNSTVQGKELLPI